MPLVGALRTLLSCIPAAELRRQLLRRWCARMRQRHERLVVLVVLVVFRLVFGVRLRALLCRWLFRARRHCGRLHDHLHRPVQSREEDGGRTHLSEDDCKLGAQLERACSAAGERSASAAVAGASLDGTARTSDISRSKIHCSSGDADGRSEAASESKVASDAANTEITMRSGRDAMSCSRRLRWPNACAS